MCDQPESNRHLKGHILSCSRYTMVTITRPGGIRTPIDALIRSACYPAYKAGVLPLHHGPVSSLRRDLHPQSPRSKRGMLSVAPRRPLKQEPHALLRSMGFLCVSPERCYMNSPMLDGMLLPSRVNDTGVQQTAHAAGSNADPRRESS